MPIRESCRRCQNWDNSKFREIDTLADEVSSELIVQTAARTGVKD